MNRTPTTFKCGLACVITLLVLSLSAPLIAPYAPNDINLFKIYEAPSAAHLFGTDHLGRDVLSRMLYGARISLLVGFVAVGISTLIGMFLGAIAGYVGGKIDRVIMGFVDLMLCFPSFFLILAVVALLEPSLINIMVVIGLTSWMGTTRLVRAEFMKLKSADFIAAAALQGLSPTKIIMKHMMPNALHPVLVSVTFGIAGAVLLESSLSFLGIGIQPPTPSWGNILNDGKAGIEYAWWLSLFPGLAIFITVLGYNLVGEGLRDML